MMDPQDLAERIYDRALIADHVEWLIMRDLFGALSHQQRFECWNVLARFAQAEGDDTKIKTIHPQLVQLVLDIFGLKLGDKPSGMPPVIPDFVKFGAT